VRNVFGSARRRYLVKVLQLLDDAAVEEAGAAAAAAPGSYEGLTLKALEASVADRTATAGDASNKDGNTVRLSLAAAYLVVAYTWLIRQQEAAAAAAGRGSSRSIAAALGLGEDSDDEDEGGDDDGWGNWEPEDSQPQQQQQQQQQQQGWSKGQGVSRMVRLCFQWVVHRELAELADVLVA
jgi:hypothetical protein